MKNRKMWLSVFAKKLSIAPAAHGVMANGSGVTMRNKKLQEKILKIKIKKCG